MNITAIKYFLCLAECMNFSEAAARNYISQSSFSKIIMKLERELGVQLIDRKHHPIMLTKGGECFYRRFKAMEPLYKEAMDDLMNYTSNETIRVLICPKSYAYKDALNDFMMSTPGVNIHFSETTDYDKVVGEMLTGNYTFGISARPMIVPPQLRMTELYDDRLYLVISKKSEWKDKSIISLKELEGQILWSSPYSKKIILELMKQFNFHPMKMLPEDETEMRRDAVFHRIIAGGGMSINPGRDITAFRGNNFVCLPIKEVPDFPVVMLERVEESESMIKQHFRRWMKEHLEHYVYSKYEIDDVK